MSGASSPAIQNPQGQSRLFQRVAVWTAVTLGVMCLLAVGGWSGCRWWLNRKLDEAASLPVSLTTLSVPPEVPLSVLFKSSDYLPDFVVYPVLIEAAQKGDLEAGSRRGLALWLIEIRAFGGSGKLLKTEPMVLPESFEPAQGARNWIARLPRQMLEDIYAANHPGPLDLPPPERGMHVSLAPWAHPAGLPGDRLIRLLEPDNPRWRQDASSEECRLAYLRLGLKGRGF